MNPMMMMLQKALGPQAATGNDAKSTTNDTRAEKQHFTAKGNRS